MYELRDASVDDKELLIKYKLSTILDYAKDISLDEKNKIISYVNNSIENDYDKYKLIIVDDNIVGCLLVNKYKNGMLLDEIYLEENYRGKGIGSSILNDLTSRYNIIYLWVYKDNKNALKLYERYNFKIVENTVSRYFMKFTK